MSNRVPKIPSRAVLAHAVTGSGLCGKLAATDLVPLARRGLAHLHWRLRGKGLLLRVPVDGVPDLLARQAETFRRMAPSGHTPRLHGVIAASERLPGGALVVEAVRGRDPVVPRDLLAIAAALAAIHDLPLPPPDARPPLLSPADPFQATLATIERHLDLAWPALPAAVRAPLAAAREEARAYAMQHAAALAAAPRALVITDAHPRNFIIRADGRAICVDLEKALYGAPAIDLAHATLPAAIAWGRAGERVTQADRQRFLAAYFRGRGPAAAAIKPWLGPMTSLVWLRTTAAFAAFQTGGAARILGPAARRIAERAIARALDPKELAAHRPEWA